MNRLILLGLLLSAITGCKTTYIADDVDFDFDFFELVVGDELHSPYVTGAEVTLSARTHDDDETRAGWALSSSNESVLRIEDQADGRARCRAVAPGFAHIIAFDEDGEQVAEGDVEVRNPTRAELWPHGWLIVDAPKREVRPVILAGGTATFEVRYFDGDQELFGNSALTVESDQDVTATPRQTMFFERREWLQITPSTEGTRSVRLLAGGQHIAETTIDVVTAADVARIDLVHEADWEAEDDNLVVVLAQPRLEDERPVYGVEFSWDLDGDGQEGLGDLFRYYYEEDHERVLGSEFDGLRAETVIEASRGYVDSSNRLGCNVAHRHDGWGWLIGVTLVVSLRLRSRSTRRRRSIR